VTLEKFSTTNLNVSHFESLLPITTYYSKQPAEGVPFYKISKILEKGTPQSYIEVVSAYLEKTKNCFSAVFCF